MQETMEFGESFLYLVLNLKPNFLIANFRNELKHGKEKRTFV